MMSISDRYVQAARSSTKLDNYVPAVAKKMREEGLHSFKELWEKVEIFMKEYPDFFDGFSHPTVYQSVNSCVRGEFVMSRDEEDYSKYCYAVAGALNSDCETLFGLLPKVTACISDRKLDVDKMTEILLALGDSCPVTADYSLFHQTPMDVVTKEFLKEEVKKALKTLTSREMEVLEKRFGLNGFEPITLDEIACSLERLDGRDSLGVSKEVVRQVEAKALRKLRHPSRSQALRTFLSQKPEMGRYVRFWERPEFQPPASTSKLRFSR